MSASVGTVYMDVEWNVGKMANDLTGASTSAASTAATQVTKTFEQKLSSFGATAARIGKQWSLYLSAPLAGLGVLAVKEFAGFESSLAKITGLVGESRQQVQAWSGDVRRIGVDFGVGGKSAADALYFITSSGIKGAQAIKVLEQSAKASAVGLGETKTVADLLTSALNAYSGTGLDAAHATDVLVAAVRDGKAEPDALAASMGRVLPIAANMGVSFDQVSAAMAAMSMTGTDADEAATQLRGIMNSLLKPSAQAKEALVDVGLSADGLKKQIREQGLLATLKTLVAALGDNSNATALVFDDVRALTGVMNILGKNSEQTAAIFKDVAGASGDLDRAFAVTSETAEFKLNKALAQGKDALIDLGGSLAPVATGLATAGSGLARVFEGLPAPMRGTLLVLGGILAVAGPITYGVGKLSQGFAALSTKMDALPGKGPAIARGISGILGSLGELAVGVAAVTAAWEVMQQRNDEAVQPMLDKVNKSLDATASNGNWDKLAGQINSMTDQILELRKYASSRNMFNFWDADVTAQADKAADELERVRDEQRQLRDSAKNLAPAIGTTNGEALQFLYTMKQNGTTFGSVAEAAAAYNKQQAETGKGATVAERSVTAMRSQIQAVGQTFFGLIDAQTAYKNALTGVTDAGRAKAAADRAVTEAQRNVQESARKVADAQRNAQAATRAIGEAERQHQAAIRAVTDAERQRETALRGVEDAQRGVTDAQNALNDALSGEESALSVERAQLALKRAQKTLKTGGFTDPLDRQGAQLDVRDAQLALKRAQDEAANAVPNAQRNLANAQRALADAQQGVISADLAIADAQHGVAQAVIGVQDAQRGAADAARAVEQAQHDSLVAAQGLKDAQYDATKAMQAVDTAQQDAAKSAYTLQQKQEDLNNSFKANPEFVDPFITSLQNLKALYPEVAAALDPYIQKAEALKAANPPTTSGVPYYLAAPGAPSQGPPRASGGPVWPGAMFPINERGPEVVSFGRDQYLIPTQRGEVIPTDKVAAKSGTTTIINNFAQRQYNDHEMAKLVERRQAAQLSGRQR